MKNYMEAGQTGILHGIKVLCLPMDDADAEKWEDMDGGCCEFYGCAFHDKRPCNVVFPCMPEERRDRMSVYFKKEEQDVKKGKEDNS